VSEKEKLEEFKKYIDRLEDLKDVQGQGRYMDILRSLHDVGWFNWIYRYAKEQEKQVGELEGKLGRALKQNEIYLDVFEQIKENIPMEFNHDREEGNEARRNVVRLINIDIAVDEALESGLDE